MLLEKDLNCTWEKSLGEQQALMPELSAMGKEVGRVCSMPTAPPTTHRWLSNQLLPLCRNHFLENATYFFILAKIKIKRLLTTITFIYRSKNGWSATVKDKFPAVQHVVRILTKNRLSWYSVFFSLPLPIKMCVPLKKRDIYESLAEAETCFGQGDFLKLHHRWQSSNLVNTDTVSE